LLTGLPRVVAGSS